MLENNSTKKRTFQSWQAAIFITCLTGLFSLFLIGFLSVRYFHYSHTLPGQERRIEEIKSELGAAPGNEALLQEVRELDILTRSIRFQWYGVASRAGYLLLFNLAVMLTAAQWAKKRRERLPAPSSNKKYDEEYDSAAAMSRRTVAGAGIILGGLMAAATFFLNPAVDDYVIEVAEDEPVAKKEFPGPPDREEIGLNWPRFRGPGGLGVSQFENIPREWDVETGDNILWKSPVPLDGQGSPIVWDDKVFLTGGTETEKQVYCYDALDGELLWTGDVPELNVSVSDIELNIDTGFAPATPCTDGRQVYAIFPTGDVAAFDFNGDRQWVVNLGVPDNVYGHASSLVGYGNTVIIQYDNGQADDDQSWLIALDCETGDTVWRTARDVMNSWTTPIIIETQYGDQLITSSEPYLIAYNPQNGEELWRADILSGEIAPSPIYAEGLILAISPYVAMIAVEPSGPGEGDDNREVKWEIDRGIPDITSPLSDGERVYMLGTYGGALSVHYLEDGRPAWQDYIGGDFYASPSLVGDSIYLFCAEGAGYILAAGDEYELLGQYPLGEQVQASPAFAEGRMYVRGEEHLFCIGYSE